MAKYINDKTVDSSKMVKTIKKFNTMEGKCCFFVGGWILSELERKSGKRITLRRRKGGGGGVLLFREKRNDFTKM